MMIKLTAALIVVFSLMLSAPLYYYQGSAASISCIIGGALMLVNLVGLYVVWDRIFAKKSIAIAVLGILVKYVVLGYMFWSLSSSTWLHPLGFVLGLSTLLFAILSMTVIKSFVRKTPEQVN